MSQDIKALVLCAGKGTRLQTEGVDLPKVMRLADGKPLLHYVLNALSFLPKENVILVVGYKREHILEAYPDYPTALQAQQLGTGHAVQCAAEHIRDFDGHVLVCCGDTPLMAQSTYRALCRLHLDKDNDCTLLSAHISEGGNYGRIVRDQGGAFQTIVEAKDCTPEQSAITEVNTGVYLFRAQPLLSALGQLKNDNAQGEYYLTDVPALLMAQGCRVGVCDVCTPTEMLGVNTVAQLQEVEAHIKEGMRHAAV